MTTDPAASDSTSAKGDEAEPHEHHMFKFNCLADGYVPYRQLFICFGCGRAFTQKVEYEEVGVKLP